jgi:diguanylate cyclase (GGDEF)-like protein
MANDAKTRTVKRAIDKGSHEEPYFIVLSGGAIGMMYKLRIDGPTLIGRGLDAEVRLDDDGVSRLHAKVTTVGDGGPTLKDLGSSNGTYVNGDRIQTHTLKDGDKIQVGSISILKFSYQDDLERTFQEQLFDRGLKDGTTGIYNKRYLLDRIDSDYSHAQRHRTSLSLLMFDIDHFKKINDTYGHPAADSALKDLALIVRKTLRTSDVFARYGGDEFVVLMREIDDAGTLVLAKRIRKLIKKHKFVFEGMQISFTISLGIASLSDKVSNASELIQVADKYLYKAKQAGRNCIAGHAVKAAKKSNSSSQTVELVGKHGEA